MLGRPVGHSLSPAVHRAAYVALGLDWTYDARDVGPEDLAATLAAAQADPLFAGFSLTMPLKASAVPLLDVLATDIGVVNTVVPSGAGLAGHNTDVDGVLHALVLVGAAPGPALVLGAGGTARAAVAALRSQGRDVAVASRRPPGWDVEWVPFAGADPGGYAVVVATTPAGATDDLAVRGWPVAVPLVDVVYAPWPTALAAAALAAGAPVVGGRDVLLGQAFGQVRLMTGLDAPVAAMTAALL